MRRSRIAAYLIVFGITLGSLNHSLAAQGKGGGKGHGGGGGNPHGGPPAGKPGNNGHGGGDAHGNSRNIDKPSHGNGHGQGASHAVAKAEHFSAKSAGGIGKSVGHAHAALASAAIARAASRGHGNDFRVNNSGDRVVIANRNGAPLLYLNENDARDMGRWRVGLVNDQVRDGAPSFCRSGAGHPVWGRQWCIDKGFGLGDYQDYRWGQSTDLGDWTYGREVYQPSITNSILQSLLGTTAYNRLALHAVELGLLEPLTGRWVSQQTGPQLLTVNSGQYPVAEVVDSNRDFRWDDLLVALLLNR